MDTAAYPQDFASNSRFHRAASALPATGRRPGTAPWPWVRDRLRTTENSTVGYLREDISSS